MKVYAILLAGGVGTRLGLPIPKQFAKLGNRTIFEHTIEKFACCSQIDYTVVVVPQQWKEQSTDLLKHSQDQNVSICTGGETRQQSLYNGLIWLKEKFSITNDDIAISHDIARPFVTTRMIQDNISVCKQYGAADTVIPATDTIVCSIDNSTITNVPNRSEMFLGQTPQTFHINQFLDIYSALPLSYITKVTDAARILSDNNVKVGLVNGDVSNIKITSMFDLGVANYILNQYSKE